MPGNRPAQYIIRETHRTAYRERSSRPKFLDILLNLPENA